MEPLFYACESENGLAVAAGERAVHFLSGYLGPSILRGRVQNLEQQQSRRYVAILDRIMDDDDEQAMEIGGEDGSGSNNRSAAARIPIAVRGGGGGGYSNLGGTPT